jgi:hypothetical protein
LIALHTGANYIAEQQNPFRNLAPMTPRLSLTPALRTCARFACVIAMLVLSLPAHAGNDWYKLGYSEGYLKQEQICQQQMQQRVSAHVRDITSENARLRDEVGRLRELLTENQQGQGSASSETAQAGQYFEYPDEAQQTSGLRDGSPRNAAGVMEDDTGG